MERYDYFFKRIASHKYSTAIAIASQLLPQFQLYLLPSSQLQSPLTSLLLPFLPTYYIPTNFILHYLISFLVIESLMHLLTAFLMLTERLPIYLCTIDEYLSCFMFESMFGAILYIIAIGFKGSIATKIVSALLLITHLLGNVIRLHFYDLRSSGNSGLAKTNSSCYLYNTLIACFEMILIALRTAQPLVLLITPLIYYALYFWHTSKQFTYYNSTVEKSLAITNLLIAVLICVSIVLKLDNYTSVLSYNGLLLVLLIAGLGIYGVNYELNGYTDLYRYYKTQSQVEKGKAYYIIMRELSKKPFKLSLPMIGYVHKLCSKTVYGSNLDYKEFKKFIVQNFHHKEKKQLTLYCIQFELEHLKNLELIPTIYSSIYNSSSFIDKIKISFFIYIAINLVFKKFNKTRRLSNKARSYFKSKTTQEIVQTSKIVLHSFEILDTLLLQKSADLSEIIATMTKLIEAYKLVKKSLCKAHRYCIRCQIIGESSLLLKYCFGKPKYVSKYYIMPESVSVGAENAEVDSLMCIFDTYCGNNGVNKIRIEKCTISFAALLGYHQTELLHSNLDKVIPNCVIEYANDWILNNQLNIFPFIAKNGYLYCIFSNYETKIKMGIIVGKYFTHNYDKSSNFTGQMIIDNNYIIKGISISIIIYKVSYNLEN